MCVYYNLQWFEYLPHSSTSEYTLNTLGYKHKKDTKIPI